MRLKPFIVVLEDSMFKDGLDITCYGYDVEDAINGIRLEYKKFDLTMPKVIRTEEIIKKPSFFERFRRVSWL